MTPENRIHVGNLGPGDVILLKQVAEEAAKKAVHDAFLIMGLDLDDPIGSQQNFAVLRELSKKVNDPDFRADLDWIRKTRLHMEGIVGKIILTALGLGVIGTLQATWAGFKSFVGH